MRKPSLSFLQILSMNFGFFGIQFSFGLQQSNMSPIYRYLGASEATLPYLWLAGPITGLLVQPLIGALSDRTISRWGRRTPYFLVGAVLCSLCLLVMPFSSSLWMAARLLWILDAANNTTMEPYRAFISDKLNADQRSLGFLTQSAFTGLGQTLAYLTPSLLVVFGMGPNATNNHNIPYITITAFLVGAVFSVGSIAVTLITTREIPLSAEESAALRRRPRGIVAALKEIGEALLQMPPTMRQLFWTCLFQWYAMFCYWQYIVLSLARTLFNTGDPVSDAFRDAGLVGGQIGAAYNFIACIGAFAMVPLTRRIGARKMHAICVALGGIGMLCIPMVKTPALLYLPMLGVGLAWASIMGNPYIVLADSIPPHRTGVYMGIFNMFIVIPMAIQILTLPLYYNTLLRGNPENVIRLAGALMLAAAFSMRFVRGGQSAATAAQAVVHNP